MRRYVHRDTVLTMSTNKSMTSPAVTSHEYWIENFETSVWKEIIVIANVIANAVAEPSHEMRVRYHLPVRV